MRYFPLLFLAACAPEFPHPLTATEAQGLDSGPALVAYLSQRDANADVCNPKAHGPHVQTLGDDLRRALAQSVSQLPAKIWRRCTRAMLQGAAPVDGEALLLAVAPEYRRVLTAKDFEKSPALQAQLQAMQDLYLQRPSTVPNTALQKAFADLRQALAKKKLGPLAAQSAQTLMDVVDLESGNYGGRPLDAATLDALLTAKNEAVLRLAANRLPGEDSRRQAKMRLVKLRANASPFAEAKTEQAQQAVVDFGENAVELNAPPKSATLDQGQLPKRRLVVRESFWTQSAKLLGDSGAGISVLPELHFRQALLVDAGLSQPISVCRPARDLSVAPCVALRDLKIDNRFVYRDKNHAFRVKDTLPMADALSFAATKSFDLQVSVAGTKAGVLSWPLFFERPENVIYRGAQPGDDGPELEVVVSNEPERFVFTVRSPSAPPGSVVVEKSDAAWFRLVSRGADGAAGIDGMSGSDGSDGAACQNGSDGQSGGDGGPGGNGGNGGAVTVQMLCTLQMCSDNDRALVRAIVGSEGGSGGPGGNGGSGGHGGSGGAAQTTTVTNADGSTSTTEVCSAGVSGSDGSFGNIGQPGHAGSAAKVTFVNAR